MMVRRKRITIKDVAEAAGVSTAAVSQALRPRENSNIKLQEGKVQLIRETAKRLNYRPHSGARSIRSQRFGSIGYVEQMSPGKVYAPRAYQHGVFDAVEDKDFRLTLIRIPQSVEEAQKQLPTALTELHLDALIIESYSELASRIYELYADEQFPLLYLNDKHDVNSVFVEEVEGASLLTEFALQKGYRRIAFVQRQIHGEPAPEKMHHSAVDRNKGYKFTLEKNGLTPNVVVINSEAVLGEEAAIDDEQWRKFDGYDALIAYDDDLANAIARGCLKRGISIPSQLGIAGFNGDYAALSAWLPLTTMRIPTYQMGLSIGRMATERVAGQNQNLPSQGFVPSLIQGGTL